VFSIESNSRQCHPRINQAIVPIREDVIPQKEAFPTRCFSIPRQCGKNASICIVSKQRNIQTKVHISSFWSSGGRPQSGFAQQASIQQGILGAADHIHAASAGLCFGQAAPAERYTGCDHRFRL
jgi:hypothetical protein